MKNILLPSNEQNIQPASEELIKSKQNFIDTKQMAEQAIAANAEFQEADREKKREFKISDELAYLLGDLRILKKAEGIKENRAAYQEKCFATIKEMEDFFLGLGTQEFKAVSELYNKYKNELDILAVRKENPEKVVSLAAGQEQPISFDLKVVMERGNKYANCAIWPHGHSQVAGIANAFLEGRHMAGPIALVMAVRPHEDHLQIEIPEDAMAEIGDIKREAVRIMSGTIKPEDLEFVIVRTQREFYPNDRLTEAERKSKEAQIFRAYRFNK